MEIIDLGWIEAITALITVVSVLFSALVNKYRWSSKVKSGIAFATATVIAVGYLVASGQLTDWENLAITIPMVFGVQQVLYKLLLEKMMKKVEVATDKSITTIPTPVIAETPPKG